MRNSLHEKLRLGSPVHIEEILNFKKQNRLRNFMFWERFAARGQPQEVMQRNHLCQEFFPQLIS
jgi:hypothetical protein